MTGALLIWRYQIQQVIPCFHSSLLQALSVALDPEGGVQAETDSQFRGSSVKNNGDLSFTADDAPAGLAVHHGARAHGGDAETDDAAACGAIGFERPGSLRAIFSSQSGGAEGPDAAVAEAVLADWDDFMQHTLHGILDHQMVGSYTNIANLSAMSQVQ